MCRKLFWVTCLLLCLLTGKVSAQAPNWALNVQDYQYQMALVGVINIDGVESTDTNDMLGAFIDGELRGVGKLVFLPYYNRHLVYMNIYHHDGSGVVRFKIYDASLNRVVELEQTEAFEIQTLRGSTIAPVAYSYPRLSSEANIFSFNLPGQDKSSVTGSNILVTMPYGSDVRSIAASFIVSPLSKVFINQQPQQSGVTANNFNNPLSYKVIAADATTEKSYTVSVNYSAAPPQGVVLSNTQLSESAPIGAGIATLKAIDPDNQGTFKYYLINGAGDQDNAFFQVQNDQLLLRAKLDFEKQVYYSFRIKAVDEENNAVEAILQIESLNENDEKPVATTRVVDILENLTISSLVHTLEVSDPDGQSTYTYKIYDGNLDGKFTIHSQKGEIRVLELMDYELGKRTFDLDVLVSDGINESHTTITFKVQNVNDNAPVVQEAALSLKESSKTGHVLHLLVPSDKDENTVFTYQILNSADMPFGIDPSGKLSLTKVIDFEKAKKYDLRIEVSDGLNKIISSFPVQVLNENDETPRLTISQVDVLQTVAPETLVAQLQATDADMDGSPLTFSLLTPSVPFEITGDGRLITTGSLTLFLPTTFKLKVAVTDQVNTGEYELTVNVRSEGLIEMEVANVLTPNGDGHNDFWEVKKGYLYQRYIFRVFDLHGQEVFFKRGYKDKFWDGTFQGKKLPSGTYVYIIQSESKVRVYKGTLTILH